MQQRAEAGSESGSPSPGAEAPGDGLPLSRRDLRRALAELRSERAEATGELKRAVDDQERAIAQCEAQIAQHEARLSDSATLQDPELLATTSRAYQRDQQRLLELMNEWEEATIAFERADEAFKAREEALRGGEA